MKMKNNLTISAFNLFLRDKILYFRQFHQKKGYKVLFLGSDGIALKSFRKINEFRKAEKVIRRLDLVTTNNSKNKTAIEKYAQGEGIRTLSWPLPDLSTAEYDLGLIVAFGHLIKRDILEKFPLGMINVHPSLLPRWRGAAPIIHTLLHGDTVTGVSLMKIKPDVFDTGELISQKKVPIPKDIQLPELTNRLSDIAADMLVDCVRDLNTSLANAQPQSDEGVTYAKKIDKSISEVKWAEMDAVQVYNLYRAIYGIYPLSTKFKDKQVKLFDAFLDNEDHVNSTQAVGTLEFCAKRNAVRVLCKDGRLIYFKSLRIVGKRVISALDFYNGYIKNNNTTNNESIILAVK